MLLNYETVVVGQVCVLVPYRPEHVVKYHEWMQDPHLLQATASEPLSLEQEYDMQQSWRLDGKKCTFIVLDREACCSIIDDDTGDGSFFIENSLSAMAGDVNLFLSEEDDDKVDTPSASVAESSGDDVAVEFCKEQAPLSVNSHPLHQAELDIMIAEANCQRKGLGREASCLMMMYGAKMLGIRRFFCKIQEDNQASLALFRSLGFKRCGYAECFREVELELRRETSEGMIQTLAVLLGQDSLQTFACRERTATATESSVTDN